MVVSQLINKQGNAVKNQFIITNDSDNSISFQSYDSIVCTIKLEDINCITFGRYWDYSNTTIKNLIIIFCANCWL